MTEHELNGGELPAPAADWALFLDADGVLLEIVARPELVRASDAAIAAVGACQAALGGAVALVSGRRVADLKAIFAPLDLACAGLHGLERALPGGALEEVGPADGGIRQGVAAAARFAAAHAGVLVEDKGRTLALHTRGASHHGAATAQFAHALVNDLGPAYTVLSGKAVVEIKPAAVNKGDAIAGLMAAPPFAGRRPVFAGDDTTDEAGFAVVNAAGGISIRVGAPETVTGGTATAARWHCANVAAMIRWLAGIPARLGSGDGGDSR